MAVLVFFKLLLSNWNIFKTDGGQFNVIIPLISPPFNKTMTIKNNNNFSLILIEGYFSHLNLR